jgi:thiamine kinase-like enzyme
MELPKNIVRANGTLNDEKILKKEILYKGMNGKYVERFFLSPTKSYVFKPLTNNDQLGKEVWVNEHILSSFPNIYPKMVSYSANHQDLEQNWAIFEDLGQLTHVFNEETVFGVTKLIAWWHSLPTEKWENVPLKGPKPHFQDIVSEVILKKDNFIKLLPLLGIEEKVILYLFTRLEQSEFSKKMVLSHGDLHLGNYAVANNRMVVLDWEHTHLNMPYWDLYHVIDMSHPIFPKQITSEFREQILKIYLDQINHTVNGEEFIQEYHLFSAVFSIWMIMLILKDLKSNDGKWSKEQLENQLNETVSSLKQCANSLY